MSETKKHIILIVEDEVSLRNALIIKFKREGFLIFDAKDGEIGFELALKERPDIILLDMVMPKMDGMTMLKKLREENDWSKKVPVIILTNLGADDEQKMKSISEDSLVWYLVKSDWAIGDLIGKVKGIISKSLV
jgi:DNA-binding response OmpR family regulator